MDVKVYNQEGKEAGAMELPKIFALPWNADLVHQVVTSQAANRRVNVAHVKNRGDVSGGGRKPWRQKGTGRARHGSIRSPLWKGGGVTHGPTKERSFQKKINRKMAARALATVLAAKIRDNEVVVLDALSVAAPKTREAAKLFTRLAAIKAFADIIGKKPRALVLLAGDTADLKRALKNYPAADLIDARNVTALDVMRRKYIVVPKAGVADLIKRLAQ